LLLKSRWEGLDIDKSGKLDKEETKKLAAFVFDYMSDSSFTEERFEAAFERFDTNKDGKMGKKEAHNFFLTMFKEDRGITDKEEE
jgi:hypothetical protein